MSESIFNNAIYLDDVPQDEWRKMYIGDGYRSIVYMTNYDKTGRIILFGFDKKNNPKTFVCPWKSHVTYRVEYDTGVLDNFGKNVATKYFNSKRERDQFIENSPSFPIVECLKPELEFAHAMFDDVVLNDTFNKQPLRMHYFDIETEISDQFEKPSTARNRINMMTIYDTLTKKYYTWSLGHAEKKFVEDPLKDEPIENFEFFEFFDNESKMLEHFLSWYEDNYPDVNVSYNGRAFDMPYLVRRIENILGKNDAKRLSPIGRYFIKEVNHDNARADVAAEIEVNIAGLFIADDLILYRDKFKLSGATLDGGYKLDNVGEYEGCGHKIHYDGSLKDLYLKDFQKFYEYNVRDVDLLRRIDEKRKITALARAVTSFGLSDYNTIYSSLTYLINSIISFAKVYHNVVFKSYVPERKEKFPSFEGAFVFPTIPGIYRGGIGTIDFSSLYPTIIRILNISPETYVGKLLIYYLDEFGNPKDYVEYNDKEKTSHTWSCNMKDEPMFNVMDDNVAKAKNIHKFAIKQPNGKIVDVSLEYVRNLIETKCIYSPNNTLFLRHEVKNGIVAKWCEHFYNLRKTTKKVMLKEQHLLNNKEKLATMSAEDIEMHSTLHNNLDATQLALKLMINSIYGLLGTQFSPIAHPDIAQSVTRMGKFCNQSTQKFVGELFKKLYNTPDDYVPVCGMDTDSIFINMRCISELLAKKNNNTEILEKWSDEQKRELWDTAEKIVEQTINPYVRNLAHEYCHTNNQNILTYELEYMSASSLYESKKHYFAHLIFVEGDLVDKHKVTGIELKKAQVPKEIKKFLEDIYTGVVDNYWGEKEYQEYVNDLFDKFSHFSMDHIAFWKGYSTEREASGFLQMQVGTTGIAKACTYYNQLIQHLGLSKKYENINVGDKVRFIYLIDNNRYGINCIAYKDGQWPKEFNDIFEIDYKTMFNKIILDPLKGFRKACRFSDHDPSKQLQFDIFDL